MNLFFNRDPQLASQLQPERRHAPRRAGLRMLGALGLVCALPVAPAIAQDFPSRPIKLINPLPSGPIDGSLRALAERLSVVWKQPVVVEGKPGASEIIAGDVVARAPADGYTILISTDSNFTNNQYVFAKLPFDPVRDLVPVTQLYDMPFGLIVRGDLDVKTVSDFVGLMKKDGANYKYASTGLGGSIHLAMESFRHAAGFEMVHVPYKQASQIQQDMLGGSVDAITATAQIAAPFVPSGKLKMLAISGSRRLKVLPNVPTFAEAGYPNVDIRTFLGMAVPKGTPAAIVQKISADVNKILMDKDFQEKVLEPNGYEGVGSTPQQFADFIARKGLERQVQVKALNIKLE